MTIFTIGHSAQTQDQFLATLRKHNIGTVIDIRTHPLSKWQWFNLEELADHEGWLATAGIEYAWRSPLAGWQNRHTKDPQLGGRMAAVGVDLSTYGVDYYPRQALNVRTVGKAGGWDRRHEVDFAWYTVTPEFQTAILKLMEQVTRGQIKKPVLMCSEYDWAKCHRAQVADFITYHHGGVTHLMGEEAVPHDWHQLARMNKYDHDIVAAWGGRQ